MVSLHDVKEAASIPGRQVASLINTILSDKVTDQLGNPMASKPNQPQNTMGGGDWDTLLNTGLLAIKQPVLQIYVPYWPSRNIQGTLGHQPDADNTVYLPMVKWLTGPDQE